MDMKRDAADQPSNGPGRETHGGRSPNIDAAAVAAVLREQPLTILEQLEREIAARRDASAAPPANSSRSSKGSIASLSGPSPSGASSSRNHGLR